MTESSTPTPPVSNPPKRRPVSPPPAYGAGRGILVFIFRLLLLGVSGILAVLLGIAIANLRPGNIQSPPFAEKLLQGSQTLWRGINRLPQSWQTPASPQTPGSTVAGTGATGTDPAGTDPAGADPADSPTLPAPPEASPTPTVELSETDRQQVETELTAIQTELQQLNSRAGILESRVGATNSGNPLEERLQTIERQLDPDAVPPPAPSPSPAPAENQSWLAPTATTLSSSGEILVVTLPSDALFDANQPTELSSTAPAILDTLIADLQRFPGATVRVVGHTDRQGPSAADRARSFEQANAVAQYFSGQLGENARWLVVGLGSTRPVAENTSDINRQRNRRVEIFIDPT
ncbi:OmpA family protein [Egbenema bharatensis]|uniref:OmpA family protein n=1 Tax=Egbenema bharatensis TaxID=3463334 RepID=UPI003A8C4624